jgi:hypothetical protein
MNIPETMKRPSSSDLGKRPQGILRNQSTRSLFGFESSFQKCFWIVFIEMVSNNKNLSFCKDQQIFLEQLNYDIVEQSYARCIKSSLLVCGNFEI